jgi:hypothetical protein
MVAPIGGGYWGIIERAELQRAELRRARLADGKRYGSAAAAAAAAATLEG